jgi:threonine dehydratase
MHSDLPRASDSLTAVATVESSPVTADDVRAARPGVATTARRTPVLSTRTFSERAGGIVALKAENLQRTGSFKVRGAGAKLTALGQEGCAAGVVGASAGNHAQALAAAARTLGVRCEVFVPADAPIAKTEAARGLGAIVHIGGASVDDCVGLAQERAREGGLAFVHPFDDADVIAGQGTLGLELLEEVPDLARVVIPVGGGGLCSGVAIAVKSARPEVEVVGVQVADTTLTIADGIAVKAPGELTSRLLDQWVDDMAVVGEDETAEAMVLLMERCKLVVEGAGAVGVAALLGGQVAPAASGTTVAVLSGGNVDPGLLASIARRHETEVGRRLVLLTRVADRPGALAGLLACVAETGANIVHVSHHREGLDLHVRETAVELVLETRGHEHAKRVRETLLAAGYEARTLT